jgi:hypothetical protein
MNLLDNPLVRLAIVAGLTYAAWRYLPNTVSKTIALAVGGTSGAVIVGNAVPLVGSLMAGRLPVKA